MRLLAEVAPEPQNIRIASSVLDELAPLLEGENDDRMLVAPREEREAVRSLAPRRLAGGDRVVDRSRIDGHEVRIEKVASLLEERALLGVEQGECGVHVDLRDVGFDLAEIGIDGRLGLELRGNVKGDTEADIPLAHTVLELSVVPERAGLVRYDRRQELEALARLDAGYAGDGPPLAGPAILVAVIGRPRVLVERLARAVSPEVDSPRLLLPVRETQAREGHRDLRHPTLIGDPARRLVDDIVGHVLAGGRREEEIPGNPVRVDGDLVGVRRFAVRVETQEHDVVAEDLVPLAEGGPHLLRLVVADEADVEVAVVVRDEGLRIDGRLGLVAGTMLGEVRGLCGSPPARVVKLPVDLYRARGPGDLELGVIGRDIRVVRARGRKRRGQHAQRNQTERREPMPREGSRIHSIHPLIVISRERGGSFTNSPLPVLYTNKGAGGSGGGESFSRRKHKRAVFIRPR